jgi:hypothetical protein
MLHTTVSTFPTISFSSKKKTYTFLSFCILTDFLESQFGPFLSCKFLQLKVYSYHFFCRDLLWEPNKINYFFNMFLILLYHISYQDRVKCSWFIFFSHCKFHGAKINKQDYIYFCISFRWSHTWIRWMLNKCSFSNWSIDNACWKHYLNIGLT